MGYFPFFADISGARCLVVGGGKVALRKVKKLLPFGVKIRVVAPEICEEIIQLKTEVCLRKFERSDLDNADFVISATNDENVSKEIYELCRQLRIPVNTVDDQNRCSFIFPALATCGDAVVGISTGGKSPLYASFLRKYIEDNIDEKMIRCGEIIGKIRPYVKERFDGEKKRKYVMDSVVDFCMNNDDLPSEHEIYEMIDRIKENENQNRNS